MPARKLKSGSADAAINVAVPEVLRALRRMGSKKVLKDMRLRYGIQTEKAWGVPMHAMLKMAKGIGIHHPLALALWETGWYEARMVASMIDDAAQVTPRQMDAWCDDFDNWAICDTVCFKLFDRSPHALAQVSKWAASEREITRRAAHALLACVALHQRTARARELAHFLPHIERAAMDERNFVKKGVSWALRSLGRRGGNLQAACQGVAERLAQSPSAAARWVGKEALRDFARMRRRPAKD